MEADYRTLVDGYNKGYLLRIEVLGLLQSNTTIEDLTWLKAEEPEWYQRLLEDVAMYPADDDQAGWDKCVEIGGCVWESKEAYMAWKAKGPERAAKHRAGIRLIREFQANNQDSNP